MKKNILIIHFNTPVLTSYLVKSINKHTPDAKIYIFDNSDKKPFVNEYENVTVFNNTKGQIINFEKWLKKYPNRKLSGGKTNKWGSAKHAYSVEKCMELIGEPFILLDSDVLVKQDLSGLYDDKVCYRGEVKNQPKSNIKRVLPFVCYINTEMCRKHNVHYFDEKYMHGLRVGAKGDCYDTGAALYLLALQKKVPHREIKYEDYVIHYGSGSWTVEAEKMKRKKQTPANVWLTRNKKYWETEEHPEKLTFSGVFDHIYCLHDLENVDRLENMRSELKRVGIDDSAEYFSWVYDYRSSLLDLVYKDKRLNMDPALRTPGRDDVKMTAMKHYRAIKEAYSIGYDRVLIMEDNLKFHKDLEYIDKMLNNIPDADVVMFDKMTCSAARDNIRYKEYVKGLPDGELYGDMKSSGVFFIFPTCYAVNRNAMRRIVELQEKGLIPADTPLNDKELTGSFAVTNIAIRNDKLKDSESYTRIGLDIGKYESGKGLELPAETVKKTVKSEVVQPPRVKPVAKPVKKKVIIPDDDQEPERNTGAKKPTVPDKAIRGRKKTVFAKMVGHNSLYDVY